MRSEFFRSSTTWVVDFRFDGRPRRWFKTFRPGIDVLARISAELRQLYGDRAELTAVREATPDEESQYMRGEEPTTTFCPTGRRGSDPRPP